MRVLGFLLVMVTAGSAAEFDEGALRGFLEGYEPRFGVPDLAVAVFSSEERLFGYGEEGGGAYTIGSVSKAVTALGVLRLVEGGKIGLDDGVVGLLDGEVSFSGADGEVTVRHLMNHRSGLRRKDGFLELEAGMDLRLRVEPGERFSYSNLNYALLGRVIEKVTGVGEREPLRPDAG